MAHPARREPSAPARTHVMVTGGLGNQLFQYAAALDVARGNEVVLWPALGAPRCHDGVTADLLRLPLPAAVHVGALRVSGVLRLLAQKASGYMLRIGVIGSALERDHRYRALAAWAASLAVLPALRRRVRIRAAVGIGFDPVATGPGAEPLLLGYFQTWRHASATHVRPTLTAALEGVDTEWFREMQALAAAEAPIIVHVRLGDYRKEPGLGIIEPAYYEVAVAEARALHPDSRIWLFSDEPDAAIAMLPADTPEPRVVNPPDASTPPAELLRVMTLGRCYVLANSTFGWWAALLAADATRTVTVPEPWFVIGEQPRDLIPSDWQRRSRSTGAEVRS